MSYETILKGKYPAKAHARRVVDVIREQKPNASGVLYLEGRMTKLLEDSDSPEPFRQRRYFYYLSGCSLADCYLMYEIASEKTTLFIPPIDPESVMWSGLPMSSEEALTMYDVDEVRYTTDVNPALAHAGAAASSLASAEPSTAFAIAKQVSPDITLLGFDKVDFSLLKDAINRCRVVKDEYEVAMIEKANSISTGAHHAVMQRARHVANETELEAVIVGHCAARGAKRQAYDSIVASGRAAATLHYVHNDQPMPEGKQNVLIDAGCEWDCYAADITRTFPISGNFTPESRAIYDTVLRMQTECIDMLKEDVQWETVHLHAHRMLIEGLLDQEVLCGGTVDEILENRTSVAFMPHGLGHYLGMDTHDTGGNPNYEDKDPIFRYLRVRGTLPAGAVITVEPGIYFCRFIIEQYLKNPDHAKFIDESVLERFWDVGGVRIEDNILITRNGSRNLTPAIKDPVELEKMVLSCAA